MKKSVLTIKSYYKGVYNEEVTIGYITLKSGRKFKLRFEQKPKQIIVESLDEKSKEKLTIEERTEIIETIISELLMFYKSVLKGSIRLDLELSTLVDNTTNQNIETKNNIILEFVNSPIKDKTENKVLILLLDMYSQIMDNKEKIGNEDIHVKIPEELLFYKPTAKYLLRYTLIDYAELVEIENKSFKGEIILKALK